MLWAPYLNQSFRRRLVALLDRYDSSVPVSFYVIAVLVITIGCVLAASETSKTDLKANLPPDREKAWAVWA